MISSHIALPTPFPPSFIIFSIRSTIQKITKKEADCYTEWRNRTNIHRKKGFVGLSEFLPIEVYKIIESS